jgi:hypothetical protein
MPTLPIADIRAIWQHYLDRLLRFRVVRCLPTTEGGGLLITHAGQASEKPPGTKPRVDGRRVE